MSALVSATGINKSYGRIEVLKNVSFDLLDGQSMAIIGPNGAGKTTLFKVLTGEVPLNTGRVVFKGEDVTARSAAYRTRAGFARTFQVSRVFLESTALENMICAVEAQIRNAGNKLGPLLAVRPGRDVVERSRSMLRSLGLDQKRSVEARFLSHGDKKRLELGMALALDPAVLMLDEPTAGMSPAERHQTIDLIARLKQERSVSMLLTEHDMDVVFGLTSRLMVLNYGEIVAVGTIEEVRNNPLVREVYLGKEMEHA